MKLNVKLLFVGVFIFNLSYSQDNVGIGTLLPHSSAILELSSTTQGFLPARMDSLQMASIPSPALGLMIYNITDNCYWYNNGKWTSLCKDSVVNMDSLMLGVIDTTAWKLKGNSGTNPSINFIGTTDAQDWVVKTDNTERIRVLSTGNVGIGTSTPSYKLHIVGKIKTDGINETSDKRFKENIVAIPNSLDKVQKIRGVFYDWRVSAFPEKEFEKSKQVGVIAQEIETVLPELVKTDEEGYKSVEYSKLTALLIEAVKELKLQNENLRSELSVLTETSEAQSEQLKLNNELFNLIIEENPELKAKLNTLSKNN